MIISATSALSAVSAYQKKMDVTANNVANVNTDKFKKSRLNLEEGANGGVTTSLQQINTPGFPKEITRDGETVETESSNVDLAEEFTDMMVTEASYTANLKTVKAQDEMIGSLLDTIG